MLAAEHILALALEAKKTNFFLASETKILICLHGQNSRKYLNRSRRCSCRLGVFLLLHARLDLLLLVHQWSRSFLSLDNGLRCHAHWFFFMLLLRRLLVLSLEAGGAQEVRVVGAVEGLAVLAED